jgi:hypothetical protein
MRDRNRRKGAAGGEHGGGGEHLKHDLRQKADAE